jgi:hypothetical protein
MFNLGYHIAVSLSRTISAFHCLIQWFPPHDKDPLSVINFLIFWIWPVVIFYNYFRAIFVGPGEYFDLSSPAQKKACILMIHFHRICARRMETSKSRA